MMRKLCRIPIRLLLLSLILCALLATGSAQEAAVPQDMLAAYRGVVLGEQVYLQADPFEGTVTETMMTPEIRQWYGYLFDIPLRYEAFAVTDLDKDGNPELLLKLSNDFGFELLRFHDGAVYGYPFVARAMEAVTADGEIHAASGAANFGWVTLTFNGSELLRSSVCWMSDEETDTIRYTIGGVLVTESEFQALNDTLWAKPMIEWTENIPEALDAITDGE